MSKEIIKKEKNEITEKETNAIQEKNEIEKLRKYVKTFLTHENLNENEIEQFIEVARAQKLDPFKKELHVVPFETSVLVNGKWTKKRQLSLITGYEVYLRRADLIPVYDFFETEYLGEFGKPDFRCQIKMYRKDRTRPLIHECYYNEFVGKKGTGEITKFWRKMPRFMLKKVTVSQGLRWAFPNDFENMPYIKEEIEAQIIDVTPKKETQEKLQKVKKNMDKDTPDFEVKEFEKEKTEIMDTTGVKLNEDGSKKEKKEPRKKQENQQQKEEKSKSKFPEDIYIPAHEMKKNKSAKELFPDEKTEPKNSNFAPVTAYENIFDDDRAKKLKDFMNEKDYDYFYDLACSDAEDFKEKDYKKSLKLIEDYEKIKQEKEKRNQEKGRK